MTAEAFTAEWLYFIPETDRWLVSVVIAFIAAFTTSTLFKKLNMSEMVGEILAGIILGLPVIKAGLLNDEAITTINELGEVGALLLLALAGLEIELGKVRKASIEGTAIALLSFIVPFSLGYWYTTSLGYDWKGAFIVGIVLGVTAEEIATKVYLELGILNTRIGAATIVAAVIDDVMEVIALAAAIALITTGSVSELVVRFPIMVALFFVISFAISRLASLILEKFKGEHAEFFWLYLCALLFFSALGAALALGPIIGAILGGFFMQMGIRRALKNRPDLEHVHEEVAETLKRVLMGFLVPFFFLMVGLEFTVKYLVEYPVELIIITAIAFIGKIGGTVIAKPFSTLSVRQLWFIGWAMNARGTLGMILTLIALRYKLIGPELYTTMIAMAMVTTIVFPFVVRAEYKRRPTIVE